jgi:hypothetical protein
MGAAPAARRLAPMPDQNDTGLCEHGRPRDDCPLCEYDDELDDVLVDVEAWAEKTLAEIDAELRTH